MVAISKIRSCATKKLKITLVEAPNEFKGRTHTNI